MAYPIASHYGYARRPILGGLVIAVSVSLLLWAMIVAALYAVL